MSGHAAEKAPSNHRSKVGCISVLALMEGDQLSGNTRVITQKHVWFCDPSYLIRFLGTPLPQMSTCEP